MSIIKKKIIKMILLHHPEWLIKEDLIKDFRNFTVKGTLKLKKKLVKVKPDQERRIEVTKIARLIAFSKAYRVISSNIYYVPLL